MMLRHMASWLHCGFFLVLFGFTTYAVAGGVNQTNTLMLVPFATYTSDDVDTWIRLRTREEGRVHWAFFDSNGNRRAFGAFNMDENGTHPFIWSVNAQENSNTNLMGVDGFLLFGLDSNRDGFITSDDAGTRQGISGNALISDPVLNDLVYLPVIGTDANNLSASDPRDWGGNPLQFLGNDQQVPSIQTNNLIDFQYSVDTLDGNSISTKIYIWTAQDPGSFQDMVLISEDGASKDVEVQTLSNNLNVIEVHGIDGFTQAFLGDTYLRWTVPSSQSGSTLWGFAFSLVRGEGAGMSQTLMAIK